MYVFLNSIHLKVQPDTVKELKIYFAERVIYFLYFSENYEIYHALTSE